MSTHPYLSATSSNGVDQIISDHKAIKNFKIEFKPILLQFFTISGVKKNHESHYP